MSAIPRAERIRFVGSSEIPTLAGVNPWQSQLDLWAEKSGLQQPDNLDGKPAVEIGKALEAWVAQSWADTHGVEAESYPYHHVHPAHPRWGSSYDWLTSSREPIEVKCVGIRAWEKWRDGPPDHVIMQAQSELACLPNAGPRAWIVALPLGFGDPPESWEIESDDMVQAGLLSLVSEFWQSVDEGTPPEPRRGDGAAAVRIREAARRLRPASAEILEGGQTHAQDLRRHHEIGQQMKAMADERKQIQARLMGDIGGAAGIEAGGYRARLSHIPGKTIPARPARERGPYSRFAVRKLK